MRPCSSKLCGNAHKPLRRVTRHRPDAHLEDLTLAMTLAIRENPEDATAYGNLKKRLARQHVDDIDAYVEAKTEFVAGLLRASGFSENAIADIGRLNRNGYVFWRAMNLTDLCAQVILDAGGISESVEMSLVSESWFSEFLSCPDCGGDIFRSNENIICSNCKFSCEMASPVELMPNEPEALRVYLPRTIECRPASALRNIDIVRPEISYDGPLAMRDSRELLSEMKRHLTSSGKVLDLGCGPRDQAIPIGYLGYQYVGIDYSDKQADLLADAHAIPFKDETFDCVISYAVLEHLHNPFIAVTEIERVLRRAGVYIGTVSQGEPFHDSYFHHTSWGLLSLVSSVTNFQIQKIWGSGDTLASLSRMGRYPKIIKSILAMVDKMHSRLPFLAPRKMKWPDIEKNIDKLHRAASICFVAKKMDEKRSQPNCIFDGNESHQ